MESLALFCNSSGNARGQDRQMTQGWRIGGWLTAIVLVLTGGQQTPPPQPSTPPAQGSGGWGEGKVGKAYSIDGRMYYPEHDAAYDKIGDASWYGPGFHGKYTASGEIFNQNDLTAAHPTLPMPSLVRVTNLINGQ